MSGAHLNRRKRLPPGYPPFAIRDDLACSLKTFKAFFPEDHRGNSATAQSICGRCPVEAECLNWALESGEQFGILGGMTAKSRARLLSRQSAGVRKTPPATAS